MKILKLQKFILIFLTKNWMIWTYRFLSVSTDNVNKLNVPFILMLCAMPRNEIAENLAKIELKNE